MKQYDIEVQGDAATALLTFKDEAGREYTAGALLSHLRAEDGSWHPVFDIQGLRITKLTLVQPS